MKKEVMIGISIIILLLLSISAYALTCSGYNYERIVCDMPASYSLTTGCAPPNTRCTNSWSSSGTFNKVTGTGGIGPTTGDCRYRSCLSGYTKVACENGGNWLTCTLQFGQKVYAIMPVCRKDVTNSCAANGCVNTQTNTAAIVNNYRYYRTVACSGAACAYTYPDCNPGTTTGLNYCSGKNIMRDTTTRTCSNTLGCQSSISTQTMSTCAANGCVNTQTDTAAIVNNYRYYRTVVCSGGACAYTYPDCNLGTTTGLNYCSGKNIVRDATTRTCSNTLGCQSSISTQTMSTCACACSGGACIIPTFYRDADGDGYGNPSLTTTACTAPAGYVNNNQDCDDTNSAIKPGATEICDGKDNNCNGQIDENAIDGTYSCPSTGAKYCSSSSCNAVCVQSAICTGRTPILFGSVYKIVPAGYYMPFTGIVGNGNKLDFYYRVDCIGATCNSLSPNGATFTYLNSITFSLGTISGSVNCGNGVYNGSGWYHEKIYKLQSVNGNQIDVYCKDNNNIITKKGTLTFNGLSMTGDITVPAPTDNYMCRAESFLSSPTILTGYCSAKYGWRGWINSSGILRIVFSAYTCPLAGGSTCAGSPSTCTKPQTCTSACTDADSDGYFAQSGCGTAVDCIDNDNTINPSKIEICDGKDNNCNGQIDEGLTAPFNTKQSGVCVGSKQICSGPIGWQDDYTAIPTYIITEICTDSLDNNCDNQVNEGCITCACTSGTPCTATITYSGQTFNCPGRYDASCKCADVYNDDCPQTSPNCLNKACTQGNGCPGKMDALCNCYDITDNCPAIAGTCGTNVNCGNGHWEPDLGEIDCDRNDLGRFTSCTQLPGTLKGTLKCDSDCEYTGCASDCRQPLVSSPSAAKCQNICKSNDAYVTFEDPSTYGTTCFKDSNCMFPCAEKVNVSINARNIVTQRKIALYNGKPVIVNIFTWDSP